MILARDHLRATRSVRSISEPPRNTPPMASAEEERLLMLSRDIAERPVLGHLPPPHLVASLRPSIEMERTHGYLPVAFWCGVALIVSGVFVGSYRTARGGGTATSVVNATT